MNAGARWYRIGSAITCETAGGSGVGPAVIRYCLLKTMRAAEDSERLLGDSLLQAEGRIAVRHQPVAVGVDPDAPPEHARHEVEHPAWISPGEQDREERDERHD